MSARPSHANSHAPTRALIWEEVRVGGAIAATCTFAGILLLFGAWRIAGVSAWERDDFLAQFAGIWVPIAAALLLVLNPDYSGHMVGGFSKRILRFPVTTRLAVAVSLGSRMLLVGLTSSTLLGLAHVLFEGAPGVSAVLLIVVLYLAAQVVDWLRGPVSGLTSLLAIGVLIAIARWLWPGAPAFAPMRATLEYAGRSPAALPLALVFGAILAYAASVVIVRADRVGKRYGPPEIWDWPRQLSLPAVASRRKFRSPMAAQIWFEIRRSRFILPAVFIVVLALATGAAWLFGKNEPNAWERNKQLQLAFAVGAAAAVLLGALAHGIQTRVLGVRGAHGRPGYEYLQPLTDAQFALARFIASACMVLPVVAAAAFAHYAFAGFQFTFVILPEAYSIGVASAREVVWAFMGRMLLVLGLSCLLIGLGTRTLQIVSGAPGVYVLILFSLDELFGIHVTRATAFDFFAACIVLITVCLGAHSVRRGMISTRSAVFWLATWAAIAWVLNYPLAMQDVFGSMSRGDRLFNAVTVFGAGSVVPLLYLSILLDVHRRRHPSAKQLPPRNLPSGLRPMRVGAAVLAAVAALWLGWPATPKYVESLHVQGLPATLAELESAYPDTPDRRALASRLLALAHERAVIEQDFRLWFRGNSESVLGTVGGTNASETQAYEYQIYVMGSQSLPQSQPLERQPWRVTETYWERVTSKVAPAIREVSAEDLSATRFSVEVTKGFLADLSHLQPIRMLGMELTLDALHAVVAGDVDRAIDDIAAGLSVSRSVQNEPFLIPQLARMWLVQEAIGAGATTLNRSMPSAEQLERIQRTIEAFDRDGVIDSRRRALHAEFLMSLDLVNRYAVFDDTVDGELTGLGALGSRLLYPADAQRAALSLQARRMADANDIRSWADIQRYQYDLFDDSVIIAYSFLAPTVNYLLPSFTGFWDTNFRVIARLDALRVVLAAERFRIEHDRMPDALPDLVPAYLPAVPLDPFSRENATLQFLIRETGEYVVYSVGRNGVDQTRDAPDPRISNDDLTTTIAPLSVRSGPQIAN